MFKIICNDENVKIELSERKQGEILYLDVVYRSDVCKTPKPFKVCWDFFAKDCFSIFSPFICDFRGNDVDWRNIKTQS